MNDLNEGPYKGFLLIRCDECGEIGAYRAKKETFVHHCTKCHAETLLEDLMPAYMECKCGSSFKYLTNIKEEKLTHSCMNCGCDVDMVLGGRKTAYITLGAERRYSRKGK